MRGYLLCLIERVNVLTDLRVWRVGDYIARGNFSCGKRVNVRGFWLMVKVEVYEKNKPGYFF